MSHLHPFNKVSSRGWRLSGHHVDAFINGLFSRSEQPVSELAAERRSDRLNGVPPHPKREPQHRIEKS
jgi:hypothetical protein